MQILYVQKVPRFAALYTCTPLAIAVLPIDLGCRRSRRMWFQSSFIRDKNRRCFVTLRLKKGDAIFSRVTPCLKYGRDPEFFFKPVELTEDDLFIYRPLPTEITLPRFVKKVYGREGDDDISRGCAAWIANADAPSTRRKYRRERKSTFGESREKSSRRVFIREDLPQTGRSRCALIMHAQVKTAIYSNVAFINTNGCLFSF